MGAAPYATLPVDGQHARCGLVWVRNQANAGCRDTFDEHEDEEMELCSDEELEQSYAPTSGIVSATARESGASGKSGEAARRRKHSDVKEMSASREKASVGKPRLQRL